MRGLNEGIRRAQSPAIDRGHTVSATGAENPDIGLLDTTKEDGARAEVIGLGHTDASRHIIKNLELLGSVFTMQRLENGGIVDVSKGNAWVVYGSTPSITVAAPPAIPNAQKVPGVKIRQTSAQVVIALVGATSAAWSSNVRWMAQRYQQITIPGDPPTVITLQPISEPTGGVDFVRLTYWESLGIWQGEFFADETPAEPVSDVPQTDGDDDEQLSNGDQAGHVYDENGNDITGQDPRTDTYDPEDVGNPPATETAIDPVTGQVTETEIVLRLFALCTGSQYWLTGNGSSWHRAVGPFVHPVSAAGDDGQIVVATGLAESDAGGVLYRSTNGRDWETAGIAATVETLAVPNGDFEAGLDGWEITGYAVALESDTPAQKGDSTKYLTGDRTAFGPFAAARTVQIPEQYHTAIDGAATVAALRWDQRAADYDPDAGDPGRAGVRFLDGTGTTISESFADSIQPTGWESRTHYADIPTGARSIRVIAEGEAVTDPIGEEIALVNGDFSTGDLTGWSVESGVGANVVSGSGNPYLSMTDGRASVGGVVYQQFVLPADISNIRLEWSQRSTDSNPYYYTTWGYYNDPGCAGITFYDEIGVVVGSVVSAIDSGPVWFNRALDVAVPSAAVTARIRLICPSSEQLGPYPNLAFDSVRAFASYGATQIRSDAIFDNFTLAVAFKNAFSSICAGGGKFLVSGDNGLLMTSNDGVNWARVAVAGMGDICTVACDRSGTFFVAADTSGNVTFSTNLTAWSAPQDAGLLTTTGFPTPTIACDDAGNALMHGENGDTVIYAANYGAEIIARPPRAHQMQLAWDSANSRWVGIDNVERKIYYSADAGMTWTTYHRSDSAEAYGPVLNAGPIIDTSISGRMITEKVPSNEVYWRSEIDGIWRALEAPLPGATLLQIIEW